MNLANSNFIAFVAKTYTKEECKNLKQILVNIPSIFPTAPRDDKTTNVKVSSNIFKNKNFPKITAIQTSNAVSVHLNRQAFFTDSKYGNTLPKELKKGTKVLIISPTDSIEDMMAFLYE